MSLAMISPTLTDTKSETEDAVQATTAPVLQLVDVRKIFGDFAAVDGINVDIKEGEFVTIVGPSGSGKTTLLRMLAGMESPSQGYITLRGELINDVPADKRPTCLVFQSLALFPHKTVGENIEFPLKVRKMPAAERKARALELMRMVRLPESYYSKNVMRCSGGEKQRVALARAFAYDPDVLFFDEPLSALDYKLKKVLEKELKDLHRESGKTFVYITHSLEEAMVMSDRVGVMSRGRLVQIGTPEEIYTRPATRFVAEFFGEVNSFEVKREDQGAWTLTDGKPITVAPVGEAIGDTATVIVRPETMRFVTGPSSADNLITGKIYNEYSLGSRMQYQVHSGERIYLVEAARTAVAGISAGDTVTIGWDARDAIVVGD
ncbi:MAG: ABC transporter ATP-binding protein [Alphaproteobacteria bacterium]|nr:ABC transporter ATP-binding protein [Rhizobiaceae bacterium]MBU3959279.1 ABC transporter ATP-binding protein [Alphaproteobacteria bacterium]MBU4049217.1 ABC transporter ATP-binding protein [Alphaproteobacteria bacterium]MBU4091830.1 ABC transporter ATP-binding protein [Alphaproteobacteria bacterium]MBU4156781.1 ABC transporter ATP-binding protein [Alphaproteobacteria bacterium]